MIRGDRRDISEDKEESAYKDVNDDERGDNNNRDKDNIINDEKEDVYKKFYKCNCHAEGTGYEPPAPALRLDSPVIVY